MKNKASLALNKLRWMNKTSEEKKAHTKMMRDVKAKKIDENKQT